MNQGNHTHLSEGDVQRYNLNITQKNSQIIHEICNREPENDDDGR
jgi:hypothetical protein